MAARNGRAVVVTGGLVAESAAARAGDLGPVESERDAVITYLRARFDGALSEQDFEDIAQEAWVAVLRKRERGEPIDDVVAFMRSVAWCDARDLIRDRQETAVDPTDGLLGAIEDQAASPADHLDRRVDLARTIEAVEQLSPEQRAAYRARFVEELSTREACARLAVPRSTYHHRLRRAIEAVHATLDPDRFAELQVKLLGAYVAGVASLAERRRAERLIRTDPQSAAVARELRGAHEATAAALAPVAIDPEASVGALQRLAALPDKLRDAAASAGGRGQEAAEAAGTTLASGGSTRGAGAAGAGVLAKLAGLGGAGKIAAACLGTGAAATACVAAGVVPGVALGPAEPANGSGQDRPAAQAPGAVDSVAPSVLPSQVGDDESEPARPEEDASAPAPPAEEEPTPEPVAPEAPAVEQEVGVASAATPTGGSGGGGGGGGGGGSAVQREFGP